LEHFHVQFSRFPRHQGVTHWEGEISEGDMVPGCQVSRCPPLRYGAELSSLATSGLAFSVAPHSALTPDLCLAASRPSTDPPIQRLYLVPAAASINYSRRLSRAREPRRRIGWCKLF